MRASFKGEQWVQGSDKMVNWRGHHNQSGEKSELVTRMLAGHPEVANVTRQVSRNQEGLHISF